MQIKTLFVIACLLPTLLVGCATTKLQSKDDLSIVRGHVSKKVLTLNSKKVLLAVNDFIDATEEAEIHDNIEIVVFTVEKNGFPDFVKKIMESNERLATLPHEIENIVILENPKVKNVFNMYYRVAGKYVKDSDAIFDWLPKKIAVNFQANELLMDKKNTNNAFQSIFYYGNIVENPELIKSVKKVTSDGHTYWAWEEMINPGKTKAGTMLVPICTINNLNKEFLPH